jgi:hypothetical protein
LWAAFAVSTFGTWLAFDAFSMIAILALHASPVRVSALAAAGRSRVGRDECLLSARRVSSIPAALS